ncbi:hypothetical protein CC80DRAFT_383991, partial [Byssothecium circinans]
YAKVVNRCPYDVNLWSVDKQIGCTKDDGLVLKTGQSYREVFQNDTEGGISIKLSKYNTCGGKDHTQLEYKISNKTGFQGNYLDMSFVDCLGGDCPGWKDGFYLKSGNNGDPSLASTNNNEHCPIFKVNNAIEAAKVSYVLPDDRQTKFCKEIANLELYLCGSQPPSDSDDAASPIAAPSSSKPTTISTQAKPTTTQAPPKPATSDVQVKAAAVTDAPKPSKPEVKTVVTYVTVAVDAPVKRHAHGRRHQHFNA